MSRRFRGTAATLVGAAVLAVGCSSSGSEADPTDPPSSAVEASTTVARSGEPADAPASTIDAESTTPTSTSATTSTTGPTSTLPVLDLVDGSVEIMDPTLGSLTFDVRSAGDPSGAADGRTVLLLHGFPETNRSWDDLSLALAAAGYHAVAINQRGYSAGARPEGVENYAATHLVDDVYAIADSLGADTFHVIGHDWGSLVAWSVAGRDATTPAGRVTSLTAMSVGHPLAFAAARSNPDGDQAERSGYIDFFRSPESQEQFLADDAAFYRSIFAGAGYSDAELEAYLDVLGTPEAMGAALDWYRVIDVVSPDSAQVITQPTLFIWSTGDTALGPEQAALTADFVTGPYTYVEIPDVSHWMVHEAPDEVSAAVLAHVSAWSE